MSIGRYIHFLFKSQRTSIFYLIVDLNVATVLFILLEEKYDIFIYTRDYNNNT